MLNPGKIGITRRRNAIFPPAVTCQLFAAPVAVVKRRIGEDIIRFEVRVGIVQKRSFLIPLDLGAVYIADGQVHPAQAVGSFIAFLPVD